VVVVLLAIGGCGGSTRTTSPATSLRNTHTRANRASRRQHRRAERHRTRRPARTIRRTHRLAGGLVLSAASADAVQSQPASGSCDARGSGQYSLPDPRCTPGAVNPAVTQANIDETICRAGYTETVRPSESITEPEKLASLAAYRDPDDPSAYEYDHLVPLELGGARNDPRNLWPEPGASPNAKDTVENRLRSEVCAGQITLRAAQLAIARNWLHTGVPVVVNRHRPPATPSPRPPAPSPAGGGEGPGSRSHAGDAQFCSTHSCIGNFPAGRGTVVQCADGEWSHSGGLEGVCTDHGGPR
jgi:hypothetical protein